MSIVLVTGGAGFIGSHLVDHLLEGGAAVRVLDNLSTGSLRNLQAAADRQGLPNGVGPAGSRRLELIIGDIRDEKLVRKALRHVDRVYHLAALPASSAPASPGELHAVNVLGTLHVLQAATAEGVRRVVAGSCASVYGAPAALPVAEDHALRPLSIFAASKLAAEVYCRTYFAAHALETVCLRYFTVYGPRQSQLNPTTVVPGLVESLRQRRRPLIAGDGHDAHDFIYVDDAVEATLAAGHAPRAAGLAVNVGSGQTATPLEVLEMLNRVFRTDAVPRLARPRAGEPPPMRARITLAAEILGTAPRIPLATGLGRVVQFFAETDRQDDRAFVEVGSHEERADV
ncbi:MAG: NAD-dependent epimerase/dehydratase family protein [Candidatus Rokubacteria bacterium]|nr:NAD-dependent epimerase/dehydratase family protein [Candidatus Rokubacteria bacterium]